MLENSLKTIRLINYILIGLIVAAILLFTRSIISTSFSVKKPSTAVKTAINKHLLKNKSIMYYADILTQNPFGPSLELRPLSVEKDTPAQPSSLSDLTLVATAVGSGRQSYAIIRDKSQSPPDNEGIFILGEKVFNYGILSNVKKTYVELERDAVSYKLTMPSEPIISPQVRSQSRNSRKSSSAFARKVGERQYVLNSRKVQESIENPEHILTDARLLPNFVNGKQEGFSISEVVPDGLYHSMGLQNGDILLKVNGLEMSNPEVAIQAMTALRGMNRVNLDIIRSGSNMSMKYQVR